MEMKVLLIGASVAAGAHMILFLGAASLAWMYFKRCKRLQAQIAQHDIPDNQDRRRSESDHTDDYRRSRDGNRHRESTAGRARRERRHQRDRGTRPRDDSSPYPDDDLDNESPVENRRDQVQMTRPKRQQTRRNLRDDRRIMTA